MEILRSDASKITFASAGLGISISVDFGLLELVATIAYCVIAAAYAFDKFRRRK